MDCSDLEASHLNAAAPSPRGETRSAWNLLVRGTLQADFPDVLMKANQYENVTGRKTPMPRRY